MNPCTGDIYEGQAEITAAKLREEPLIPIPRGDIAKVRAMTTEERKQYAKEVKRARNRNKRRRKANRKRRRSN